MTQTLAKVSVYGEPICVNRSGRQKAEPPSVIRNEETISKCEAALVLSNDRHIKRPSPLANRLTTSPAASKSEQLVSGPFAFLPQTKHIHTRSLRAARECRDRLQLLGDADLSGIHYTIVNVKVCILLILNLRKKNEWATQQTTTTTTTTTS